MAGRACARHRHVAAAGGARQGGPWSRLEGELGFTLTEDFHALYAAHNGQRLKGPGLFDGLRWLTLDQVLERYRDDDGDHGAADWPDAWVPLAGDATRTLVVDFGEAPAPVLLVDRDGVGEPLAATLRGYLTKVVDDAIGRAPAARARSWPRRRLTVAARAAQSNDTRTLAVVSTGSMPIAVTITAAPRVTYPPPVASAVCWLRSRS